jgi:glyoxylate/hydroxypyruvate reductase A
MHVLLQVDAARGRRWRELFSRQAPEFRLHLWPEPCDLQAVECLIAWEPQPDLLCQLPNLRILYVSGAGVDHIDFQSLRPQVQVVRMIETGIIQGVVEYVSLMVLAAHRQLLAYRELQMQRRVMGLGVLGQAALNTLATFGFQRLGWSRSRKEIAGVRCYAGGAELATFLAQCDVLVCLLPLTTATHRIIDAQRLALLPPGSALVNAARGAHVDAVALLAALDSGHLAAAFIDVCDPEPLPAEHAFWGHPRVLLTPHIAGMTLPDSAVPVVIDNLRRHGRGEALHGLIDRTTGY